MQLIQERAEIEKSYAKSLKTWSKKWHDHIEKGMYLFNMRSLPYLTGSILIFYPLWPVLPLT